MRWIATGALVAALSGCVPVAEMVEPAGVVPIGQEPPLDPNLVYDEDPGMGCYPTDVRTGERVDVCVWVEP